MDKGRLEAFSDGVIAILITILVLELKIPHGTDWEALRLLLPIFLTYVLSFIFLGIYWNNHHHLFQATEQINGKIHRRRAQGDCSTQTDERCDSHHTATGARKKRGRRSSASDRKQATSRQLS